MDIIDQKAVMNNKELISIYAGSSGVSATLLNAIVRGINTIYELGRTLGSIIRRTEEGELCEV